MTSSEIRSRFLSFFEARGHAVLPSAPLVPENDPTVLFNTAGMQPLVPYLMGKPHPQGKRLVNSQKCVRTQDIDEVGDKTHDTFFEMLGNWSLGDYFKEEAIFWSYEFLTSQKEGLGLDPKRLYVTVFAGDSNSPKDTEAKDIWIKAGVPENRIYFLGADANWWPAVKDPKKDTWTGPTGPDTEMFYDLTEDGLGDLTHEEFLEADEKQQIVEIWNDVFMAYEKKSGEIVAELQSKNVDTGAGLERLAMVLQKKNSVFETDLFEKIMQIAGTLASDIKAQRIIADHIRTSVFIIADGVTPSNTDQGYILRRLLRRAIFKTDKKDLDAKQVKDLVRAVISTYEGVYPLESKASFIEQEILGECQKFSKTIKQGLKEFEKISSENISGENAFVLFSTYGFPLEMTVELAKEKGVEIDEEGFNKEFKKHQDISRTGAEKKFKGGLLDTSDMSVRYHTATHLLHQALHDVLGDKVAQKGSNITPERLRFDFAHDQKMTKEEIVKVEEIVNSKIKSALPVNMVTLPLAEAEKTGAKHFFGEKYGDTVNVYFIGDSLDNAYSKEFCGGPHVGNTSELGNFKITKEESVSAGVRRIKAVLE